MQFPVDKLKCVGGVIYSHLFENLYTGVPRDLYWTVEFDFDPIVVDGSSWDVVALVEWLRFPGQRIEKLSNVQFDFDNNDPLLEASFYFVEHETPHRTRLTLDHAGNNQVRASLRMEIDFPSHLDFEETPDMQLQLNSVLHYKGMVLVPQNLNLESPTAAEISALAGEYIDLLSHDPPVFEKFRWVFRPIADKE